MELTTYPQQSQRSSIIDDESGCTLSMFTSMLEEIKDQPAWRAEADKVADYIDGNQLDNETLADMKAIGMPVITENLMAPALKSVKGLEALNKLDWRVSPDGVEGTHDELADALSHKLNEAERMTNADDAISDAYSAQIGPGLGWIEVSRSYDPFAYPYRAAYVHRNEIWWNWSAKENLVQDARWLIRRRWTDIDLAKSMFKKQKDLIEMAGTGWSTFDSAYTMGEGGDGTNLALNYDNERGWTIEEMEWRDIEKRRVCLYEVWYKVMEPAVLLQSPDGRVVEYDKNNEMHVLAVSNGLIQPRKLNVSKMKMAWWLGPHKLHDGKSPYSHNDFPYVPFFGEREDRTAVPYGLGRPMVPLQDEVNARLSRMMWGMASTRVTRTEGAVAMDDEEFRDTVARPDADILLSSEAMRNGGVFKVERDYQLNEQQYKRYLDAREGIQRVAGIFNSFMGKEVQNVKSGVGLQNLTQQSSQNLADMNDNTRYARKKVGELLMSLIITDIGNKPTMVNVPGGYINEDKVVYINQPTVDESGRQFLNNDLTRTRMKVVLSDVPSTSGYRGQQLLSISEIVKSLPEPMQMAVMPFVMALTDSPNKREMIQAIKQVLGQGTDQLTPEMVKQQIDQAVQQALAQSGREMEEKNLALKERELDIDRQKAEDKAYADGLTAEANALRAKIEERNQQMLEQKQAFEQSQPPEPLISPDNNPDLIIAKMTNDKDVIVSNNEVRIAEINATRPEEDAETARLEGRLEEIMKMIQALQDKEPEKEEADPALMKALEALNRPQEPIPAPIVNVTIEKGGQVTREMKVATPTGQVYTGTVTGEEE